MDVELTSDERNNAADIKGSVAPINVVGISSIRHDRRNLSKLNTKKLR
jgi:hypothetical protein